MIDVKTEDLKDTRADKKVIKCVVWDLDDTLWNGVLLENDDVRLRADVVELIKALDSRGILQSVASKNEYTKVMAKLQEFGLHEYFLYPQISWSSKVAGIKNIAQSINIGLDALAFIDDQPFERDEVRASLPEVLCIDAADLSQVLDMPQMEPGFITSDSKIRRQMYLSDIERKKAEEEFVGPQEEFLATLNMVFTIAAAREDDLQRAEELTVRTNQLNTTGYTYSYDELNYFRQSDRHKLLIASLEDTYGSYGKIGLALIECGDTEWMLKLLLMSCRVMSRGVGTIMLNHIMSLAKAANVRLLAEMLPNDRNRMMLITYKFAGFHQVDKVGDLLIFESDLSRIQPFPAYVQVNIVD